MIPCVLLKKDLQTIWPDCSSYYLNVSQKAEAKNELLIDIIWIAHCGSTCLLEGFVHSFTLAWTAALNDASLFFFYFYPLAVNINWLYAGRQVAANSGKKNNNKKTVLCRLFASIVVVLRCLKFDLWQLCLACSPFRFSCISAWKLNKGRQHFVVKQELEL